MKELPLDRIERIRQAELIFINGQPLWGHDFCLRVIMTGKTVEAITLRLLADTPEEYDRLVKEVLDIKTAAHDGQNRVRCVPLTRPGNAMWTMPTGPLKRVAATTESEG